jgi:hypothetical protein
MIYKDNFKNIHEFFAILIVVEQASSGMFSLYNYLQPTVLHDIVLFGFKFYLEGNFVQMHQETLCIIHTKFVIIKTAGMWYGR